MSDLTQVAGSGPDPDAARRIVSEVPDPELPFLTIADLGILRSVDVQGNRVVVGLSPTYSGCPAVSVIEDDVRQALTSAGFDCTIERVMSPAWTTDWITDAGRAKLLSNDIVPPPPLSDTPLSDTTLSDTTSGTPQPGSTEREPVSSSFFKVALLDCPRCRSDQTERLSEFGSTPCKAQYRCLACLEPFEAFKCL